MKKFILKSLVLLASAVLLIFLLNALYVALKPDENDVERFRNVPEHLDICNVGSSHGQLSFDYSEYPEYASANFGMTDQQYRYDSRILAYYQDRIGKGTVVLIPVSYFSLWGEVYEEDATKSYKYYRVLPPEYIDQYDVWTDICEHHLPILTAYDAFIDVMKDAFLGDGEKKNFISEKAFSEQALETYQNQILSRLDEDGTAVVNHEKMQDLCDIIDLCKQKGAIPVLITTPISVDYYQLVQNEGEAFLGSFYDTIDSICRDKDIAYYDYSYLQGMSDQYEFLLDVHHLNEAGAKEFTRIVMEEVILPIRNEG